MKEDRIYSFPLWPYPQQTDHLPWLLCNPGQLFQMLRFVSESVEQIPGETGQSCVSFSVSSCLCTGVLVKDHVTWVYAFNMLVPAKSFHEWYSSPRRQWICVRIKHRVIQGRSCLPEIRLSWAAPDLGCGRREFHSCWGFTQCLHELPLCGHEVRWLFQ